MPKTMKIALVLDATGSMLSTKVQTLDAVNEYISELQGGKDTKKAKFTLTIFNNNIGVHTLRDDVLMTKVKPITEKDYLCDAMTPLRDAVGGTIATLSQTVEPEQRVMMVVLTDGKENASKEYSSSDLTALIEQKEKTGFWSFVFLGADVNAWTTQQHMGTHVAARSSTMSFAKGDIVETMSSMARGTQAYAASGQSSTRSFSDYLDDPDARLNTEQAASYLGYSPFTLVSYRQRQTGPAYTQHTPKGKVLYARKDLDEWMKSQRKER